MEAALRVAEVVRKLSGYVEALRAFHVLKRVTLEHRIQGSPGLREAIRAVEELVLSNPLLPLEVREREAPPTAVPEWASRPPEWSVEGGLIAASEERYRFEGHPTLVAAHSPPGGLIEGEVVEVRDWWDPEAYEAARGKVVLTSGAQDVALLLAARAGVEALVLYNPGLPGDAFPYKGLFLPPERLREAGIPVVTASSSLARRLRQVRVRVSVDSSLGSTARVPYLEVILPGRSRGPRVAVVAHICHPRPGANDNASGVAAVVEAALALGEAVDSGSLPEPRGDIVFLLVPEYTGSLAALERGLRVEYALNVDMVAASRREGGGPLRILPPPPPLDLAPAAALYYAMSYIGLEEWRLEAPASGSDHDAFNSYGTPAAMLNQWPDRYYHSDRDDADRIDPAMLREAALAVAAAAYALAEGVEFEWFPDTYTRRIAENHAARGDPTAAMLAASTLRAMYGLSPIARPPSDYRPEPPWESLRPEAPLIMPVAVTAVNPLLGARLRRLVGSGLDGFTWYLIEPVILARLGMGLRETLAIEQALHGSGVEPEKLWESASILGEAGAARLQ